MKFLNTHKSYISILLSILISALSFSFAYADTSEAIVSQDSMEAFDFLCSVGILTDDDAPKSGTEITRGYFAYLAIRLSGCTIDENAVSGDVFPDVKNTTKYAAYIETAHKLGLVHGSAGSFNPDNKITLVQALKIIIHILGYENYAAVYGGYPAGYINLAQRLNLTSGLSSVSDISLTSEDAILLLQNAANMELMQFQSIKGDDFSLDTVNGETLLFKNHGIACVEGIIEANGYTNLYFEASELAPGQILVGGITYNDPYLKLQDYIGLNVRLFYDYKSPSSLKNAKYAYILSENTIISPSVEDVGFSGGKIIYYEDGVKEKTLSVSQTVSCIMNGKMKTFDPDDILTLENGSIEFISNNSDRVVDVVKIKKYTTLLVKAVSVSSGLIIADDGSRLILEEDDGYDYEIIKDNLPTDISSVKSGDIILLSQGEGTGYHHKAIIVSDKQLTASFEEIGDGYAVVNGTRYKLSSSVSSGIKTGNTYKICLDAFDNISYVKVDNDMVYGFLYGIAKEGLGNHQCAIFTENNHWVTLDFSQKINYNGTSVTADRLYSLLYAMGDGYKRLIRYNVNDAAELVKLETYAEIPIGDENEEQAEETNTFRLSYSGTATYRYTPKSFTGKFFVDSSTKVFAIPDDMSVANFTVRTISSLNSDNSYSVNAFNVNEYLYSDVITIPAFSIDGDVSYTDKFTIVKSKGEIVNLNGEASPSLRCWRKGNEVAFPVKLGDGGVDANTYNSLTQGDVIQFKYDEENNIVFIKKYPVEDVYYTSGSHYSSSVVIGASVKNIDITGKRIRLVYTDGGDEIGITYTSTTTAALWDTKTQTFKEADVSEIIPGDAIFANTRYHVCYDIIIIRN